MSRQRSADTGATLGAAARPRPVMACDAYWARIAGRPYGWTCAVGGESGVWHHLCPGRCGGGMTFLERSDGSMELRCQQGTCTEEQIAAVLGVGACR